MINTGNFALLPEYKTKNDVGTGEDLLRRIGSTPSYEQIIGKYKDERDVTRHAGAGMRRLVENHNVEIDGEEVDIEEIDFDVAGADLNTSVELQEIVREFDEDYSKDDPTEIFQEATTDVPYNPVPFEEPRAEASSDPATPVTTEEVVDPISEVSFLATSTVDLVTMEDLATEEILKNGVAPETLFPIVNAKIVRFRAGLT